MKTDARGRAWETYFTTTSRLTEVIETALKNSHQLSVPEYNVLLQVSRSGSQGIRPSLLAREVVISPSRLTHTIKRLVNRDLVHRSSCKEDKRGGLIHLTHDGQRIFTEATRIQRTIIRKYVLDDITDEEIDVLNGVFRRISQRLDSDPLSESA